MERLGVKKAGFFADWARKQRVGHQEDFGPELMGSTTDTSIKGPQFQKFGQTALKQIKPSKLDTTPNLQVGPMEQQGPPGSATGRTREQLRKAEMAITSRQLRSRIADNPILSTSVLDTMTSTKINMDRQILMDMDRNPTKMLTQATLDYYMSHGPSIQSENQTNFEKIVSAYSETKKIAQKNINYAAVQAADNIQKLKQQQWAAPSMINITSGYSPTYYASPLG